MADNINNYLEDLANEHGLTVEELIAIQDVLCRSKSENRRQILKEQDEEYQKALEIDQACEKKQEKNKSCSQQKRGVIETECDNIRKSIKNIKTSDKGQDYESILPIPDEPSSNELACSIVFKLPENKKLERKFYFDSTIGDLYNYIKYAGDIDSFIIFSIYPSIEYINVSETLLDIGFPKRIILYVRSK